MSDPGKHPEYEIKKKRKKTKQTCTRDIYLFTFSIEGGHKMARLMLVYPVHAYITFLVNLFDVLVIQCARAVLSDTIIIV